MIVKEKRERLEKAIAQAIEGEVEGYFERTLLTTVLSWS